MILIEIGEASRDAGRKKCSLVKLPYQELQNAGLLEMRFIRHHRAYRSASTVSTWSHSVLCRWRRMNSHCANGRFWVWQ